MLMSAPFPRLRSLLTTLLLLLLCFPLGAVAETITIAGTGDSQALLRKLAVAFTLENPEDQILVPNSVGSGGGIKLVLAGRTELARVARPLKPKEQAEGLHYQVFAYSPVVFVANLPSPCLENISASQARDIFLGRINSWGQLGSCAEHKIYVANREDGDSSRTVLEMMVPELRGIDQPVGQTIYSTPETYDTLNRYQHSFGYLPKSQVQQGSLTVLQFNGQAANIENVQNRSYPLAVPLGIAWKGELSGVAKRFKEFLFSDQAQQIMLEMTAVPALK